MGYNSNSSSIANSYTTASVTGSNCVGGLVGWNDSSSITTSYATGSELGTYSVGGLVGWNNFGNITTSYATGSVSGSSYVGGLVGSNDSSSIANSYATGSVSGSSYVGGLVGWNQSSSITNSYATGDVSGWTVLGGFVGFNYNSSSITNSYATGNVSGSSNVGGLIGVDDTTNTLTNNWWYNNLSNGIGNNVSNTSVGQWQEAGSVSDFFNPSFAVYTANTPYWDFANTWVALGNTYPLLSSSFDVWSGSGNWSNAANWSKDAVPTSTTNVLFNNTSISNSAIDAFGGDIANLIITSGYTGSITQNSDLTISGNYTQSGGTFNQNANLSIGGSYTHAGGAFNAGSAPVTFTGAGTITSGGGSFNDITIDATGTYTLADALIANNNLNIQAGTLDAYGSNISVGGNWDNSGGTFTDSVGTGTVALTGSGTITSGGSPFNNLNISASGTYTVTDGITTTGNFIKQAGTFLSLIQ